MWAFKRGKKEAELELPRRWSQHIKSFCTFGPWIVGVCQTQLLVWKSTTFELYTTLQGISPIPFTRCIASLPTFLNKIIVGRQDGSAEIWNVSSGKLVYTVLPPSTSYGAVMAIEPTPALSLVAIAYEKGALLIHDVRSRPNRYTPQLAIWYTNYINILSYRWLRCRRRRAKSGRYGNRFNKLRRCHSLGS